MAAEPRTGRRRTTPKEEAVLTRPEGDGHSTQKAARSPRNPVPYLPSGASLRPAVPTAWEREHRRAGWRRRVAAQRRKTGERHRGFPVVRRRVGNRNPEDSLPSGLCRWRGGDGRRREAVFRQGKYQSGAIGCGLLGPNTFLYG